MPRAPRRVRFEGVARTRLPTRAACVRANRAPLHDTFRIENVGRKRSTREIFQIGAISRGVVAGSDQQIAVGRQSQRKRLRLRWFEYSCACHIGDRSARAHLINHTFFAGRNIKRAVGRGRHRVNAGLRRRVNWRHASCLRPAENGAAVRGTEINRVGRGGDRQNLAAVGCGSWRRSRDCRQRSRDIGGERCARVATRRNGFVKRRGLAGCRIDAIQHAVVTRADENLVTARGDAANMPLFDGC